MAEIELQQINRSVEQAPAQTIAQAERHYSAEIEAVAHSVIENPATRVILLAGPSSSGKTTTANILKDRLSELGHPCEVVSLDHFYRMPQEDYPRNPDGSYDYENVTALHTTRIVECLSDIIARRDCWMPRFDFKNSMRVEQDHLLAAQEHGTVIVEGLHALNPVITDPLPQENIRKLFVSVSTNILQNGIRILSGRKIRFLRRLTRDNLYRGADAAHTLELWPKVLAGEDRYLYPYKALADTRIDTFHRYEVGVLRGFAEKTIAEKPPTEPTAFLKLVMDAVTRFSPVAPEMVPETSLIREFIPGGIYEHLY